jgi:sigma-B regulation protein RsbU (phosphoserine phosphatase)
MTPPGNAGFLGTPPGSKSKFRPQSKLGKICAILFAAWLLLWPFAYLPAPYGKSFSDIRFLILLPLIVLAIPLSIRYARKHLLWRLRNRLIINYLLIGLAPVVLIATLVAVVGYSLAGQFAIVAATGELDRTVAYLSSENRSVAMHVVHSIGQPLEQQSQQDEPMESRANPRTVTVYIDHKLSPRPDQPASSKPASDAPAWVQGSFSGVVMDNGHFYIRAVDTLTLRGHIATVIASEPLDAERLAKMGDGIGRVTLFDTTVREDDKGRNYGGPKASVGNVKLDDDSVDFNMDSDGKVKVKDGSGAEENVSSISGGELPPPAGFYDINVTFPTLLPVRNWADGQQLTAPLGVSSRPSALYHRLFAISNRFGNIIRIALISLAIMFGFIELLALIMAARLNRTITRSVAELYEATVRVDSGDLSHQIAVKNNDQLAELSRSFNRMTSSLQRLIEEQKEKERMQSELEIAQEVQANLFPHGDMRLSTLEVHGVCRPARTVSGDYYDFLLFGENSLGLALGDISGKGISAALLMATLHSAVRAYRFAADEIIQAEVVEDAARAARSLAPGDFAFASLFQSPSRILTLLNRHLYRSTQPEKYATLWLGHYDGARRELTYSNGGQLPPLVLRRNGEIMRLDCGGMVVGLLDDQEYEQGTIVLEQNDIVVAYSDGVTEPENDFGDFGEVRLMEIVARYRHESLQTISDQVMLALTDWIGAQEQPDDITLVLARQI